MDQQWQPYSDMQGNRQARYSHSTPQQPQQPQQQQQPQPPAGFSYEAYQTPSVPSNSQSMGASPAVTPQIREYTGDGDIAMEDADPYNRMKYPSRPSHPHRVSGQYLSQEDSAAARRYSPMKNLSPSSPYANSPQQTAHNAYGFYGGPNTSARQSPTRLNAYSAQPQSYYASPSRSSIAERSVIGTDFAPFFAASSRQQPQHLPPIQPGETSPDQYYPTSATAHLNAVFGRETKSPRHLYPQQQAGTHSSPQARVPRFKKLKKLEELEPRINPQPAFRRANPEGGFISVSALMVCQLWLI